VPGPQVLFVNHGAVLGGGELSLLDIVRHTAPRARVALLSEGPLRSRLDAEGIPSVLIGVAPEVLGVRRESAELSWSVAAGALRAGVRLARIVRPGELLYANSQKAFVVAAVASVLRRRPLIWHLRDILSPDHFSRRNIRVVVRLANACATRVIANSRASAEAFIAAGGRAAKVCVVPSGIDPAPFRAVTAHESAQLRRELGLDGCLRPLIGVFGRLAPWKGQHVAIEALARLGEAELVIIGAPLFGEFAYQEELERLIGRLGLSDRVRLLGFRQDIPRLLRATDVVVHTSLAPEPFGRVLVEAMLAERPVVAADGGGAREVVEHGVTGYLVPPGDPGGLAAVLRRLIASPELRLAFGRSGRRRAEQYFTLQQTLPALEAEIATAARMR
jgi:glycosyltransferase involved in cell wall biosynthesis